MEFAYNEAKKQFSNIFGEPLPTTFFGIPQVYITKVNVAFVGALLALFTIIIVYSWIIARRTRLAKQIDHLMKEALECMRREDEKFEKIMPMGREDERFEKIMPRAIMVGDPVFRLEDIARRVLTLTAELNEMLENLETNFIPK